MAYTNVPEFAFSNSGSCQTFTLELLKLLEIDTKFSKHIGNKFFCITIHRR